MQTKYNILIDENRLLSSAFLALSLTVVCGLAAISSGFGSRWNVWSFRTGFTILRWALYGSVIPILASAFALYRTRYNPISYSFFTALFSFLCAITIVIIPINWYKTAQSVPPIHDITTDTTNPPEFEVILPLRNGAPNSSEYGGKEIARQQKQAYPDIDTFRSNKSFGNVFSDMVTVARKMGWEIHRANKETGRLEATDTTFWFGFKDDIVVRVTKNKTKTLVDVRSVSRVGKSDVGTNARRIRSFLRNLRDQLGS